MTHEKEGLWFPALMLPQCATSSWLIFFIAKRERCLDETAPAAHRSNIRRVQAKRAAPDDPGIRADIYRAAARSPGATADRRIVWAVAFVGGHPWFGHRCLLRCIQSNPER